MNEVGENPGGAAEEKFFFDNAPLLHAAFAGNLVRNLHCAEELFGVRLFSRDAWIAVAGEPEKTAAFLRFLQELKTAGAAHGATVEQRDFELMARAFARCREDDLRRLWKCRITVSPRKHDVMPRSMKQLEYVNAMRENDVVFGIGPAGTGKTYLAMALAVSEFLAGRCTRIVLTRPARESGENLGFLPGNLEEKILPYLRPLYDALYDMIPHDEAEELMKREVIEVAPLAFMRGRTLNHSFIILDEAQNTTAEQMLMFLTRMGFGSKCVITGDPGQCDLGRGERSGLLHAEKTLGDIERIAFCRFSASDVVRHALLKKIINAYCGKKPEMS